MIQDSTPQRESTHSQTLKDSIALHAQSDTGVQEVRKSRQSPAETGGTESNHHQHQKQRDVKAAQKVTLAKQEAQLQNHVVQAHMLQLLKENVASAQKATIVQV